MVINRCWSISIIGMEDGSITAWAVALSCYISHSAMHRKKADFDPHGAKTPEPIWMKLGMVDYVRDPTPHDNFSGGSSTWVVCAHTWLVKSRSFFRQADVVGLLKLYCCPFLGRPTKSDALSFTALLFFLFFQPTILSNGAEDARQIYTRGSDLGKARNRNSEISPTPTLIFTGGQKVLNLASFSASLNIAHFW